MSTLHSRIVEFLEMRDTSVLPDEITDDERAQSAHAICDLIDEGARTETARETDNSLPCDVRLPPRTIIRKGVSISTLLTAIRQREGWGDADTTFPDRTALASPQHPVGVREALDLLNPEHKKGPPQPLMYPNAEWCEAYSKWFGRAVRYTLKAEAATLSHPPAQDAPGAVAGDRLRSLFENHNAELIAFAEKHGKADFINAVWQSWQECAAALAALDPSPPLPEADGEVVADDTADMAAIGRSFMASLETVTSGEGPYKGWTPAEDPAELVLDLYNDFEEERAAREKAEQVAAGLREDIAYFEAEARRYAGFYPPHSDGQNTFVIFADKIADRAALRASTEEGKTATPSVKEEESTALAARLRGPAMDSAKRFINQHFRNGGEMPRASIPAQPDRDDDLVLVAALTDAAEFLSPSPAKPMKETGDAAESVEPTRAHDPDDRPVVVPDGQS